MIGPDWKATPPDAEEIATATDAADVLNRAAEKLSRYGVITLGLDRYDAEPVADLLRACAEDAMEIGPDFRAVRAARVLLNEDVTT